MPQPVNDGQQRRGHDLASSGPAASHDTSVDGASGDDLSAAFDAEFADAFGDLDDSGGAVDDPGTGAGQDSQPEQERADSPSHLLHAHGEDSTSVGSQSDLDAAAEQLLGDWDRDVPAKQPSGSAAAVTSHDSVWAQGPDRLDVENITDPSAGPSSRAVGVKRRHCHSTGSDGGALDEGGEAQALERTGLAGPANGRQISPPNVLGQAESAAAEASSAAGRGRVRAVRSGSGSGSGAGGGSTAHPPATAPAAVACSHPSYWAGLCVQCGAPKPVDGDSTAALGSSPGAAAGGASTAATPRGNGAGGSGGGATTTRIKHLHARGHLEVSAHEAARLLAAESGRLLAVRKLILILDLDHTLLNSVRMSEVTPEQSEALHQELEREGSVPSNTRLLHCLRDKNLWTKLRPGVHAFLEGLRPLYEMHIYTMGDRSYAAEIRRILDPEKRLFVSAISACDSTSTAAKDLDVALADERLVLILDDTEQVWPRHKRNLIPVERYHYFPASSAQWGSGRGTALMDRRTDESGTDGTMATCAAVLRDVHAIFFREGDVLPVARRDVRFCLDQRRQQILMGCTLAFSRCWPQDCPAPYEQPLWQLAERLGAECVNDYNRHVTTHLVAVSPGTAKVRQAHADGKYVVHPRWLYACMFRWRRVAEEEYTVPADTPARAPIPGLPTLGTTLAPGLDGGSAAPVGDADLQRALASAGRLG